jgi:O-antigen ligase
MYKNQPPFFAATFFPFAFALVLEKRRFLYVLVVIVYSIAIIYSNGRSSLVAVGLSIILFLALPGKRRQSSRINIYRVFGIVLVVISIMASSFLEKQMTAYNKTKGTNSFVDFKHHQSERDRLGFITVGLNQFMEQPFGHGLGSFAFNTRRMTHNDYILVLYEMGIVGFIVFIVLLAYFVKVLISLRRYVPDEQLWFWNASFVSLLVLYAHLNMDNAYTTIVLWFLFATIEIFRKNVMSNKAPYVLKPTLLA